MLHDEEPVRRPGLRAVLFDACGVLLHRSEVRDWLTGTPMVEHELNAAIWAAIGDSAVTVPSAEEVSGRLADALGVPRRRATAVLDGFLNDWQPDHQLVEAILRLRSRYRIGMVTNAAAGARFCRAYQFARYGLDATFDLVMISDIEGIGKPDPGIYRLAAERLNVTPAECLFVDDKIENVRGALDVGMAAIHHTGTARTIARLGELL
ncbi:MAG TPA: HAD-IA family hydrolase [Mycobacteriales bacterium]|nr:HAD-IA family hydrolase [Mycobacteriales bacterium]